MRTLPTAAFAVFSFVLAAVGMWLVMAPTVVGYQVAPAEWVAATWNDIIVGGLLTLVGLGLLAAQLIVTVRTGLSRSGHLDGRRPA